MNLIKEEANSKVKRQDSFREEELRQGAGGVHRSSGGLQLGEIKAPCERAKNSHGARRRG